ncbi:MAG: hypothetical protein BYD32DRAFT_59568 [Podila humilis]|nr:MAG: hypothetical protein BYD32DRAFT_59568 [Podila humilis]
MCLSLLPSLLPSFLCLALPWFALCFALLPFFFFLPSFLLFLYFPFFPFLSFIPSHFPSIFLFSYSFLILSIHPSLTNDAIPQRTDPHLRLKSPSISYITITFTFSNQVPFIFIIVIVTNYPPSSLLRIKERHTNSKQVNCTFRSYPASAHFEHSFFVFAWSITQSGVGTTKKSWLKL